MNHVEYPIQLKQMINWMKYLDKIRKQQPENCQENMEHLTFQERNRLDLWIEVTEICNMTMTASYFTVHI